MTWRRRKVIARSPEPIQHGITWHLVLECGHRVDRTAGQRGGRVKAVECQRCHYPEVFGAAPVTTAAP